MAGRRGRGQAEPDESAPPPADESPPPETPDREPNASGSRFRLPAPGSRINAGAGFILGALFWGWVGLPFLKGGPTEVKNTLRAKFLNQAPDGSWLP